MNKIEFTQSQIKAYENNATMFIVPIPRERLEYIRLYYSEYSETEILMDDSLIQIGDKDIFVQELQKHYLDDDEISSMGCAYSGEDYTTELARIGNFKECIDSRVVRVKEITIDEVSKIYNLEHKQALELFKKEYYDDMKNDYVFLMEFNR